MFFCHQVKKSYSGLTNGAVLYSQKLANFHFWTHLTGGTGMGTFMGIIY